MPRNEHEVRISLSVLDRLIDYEPEFSREPPPSRAKTLRQLKQAVRRDLEWLLNTKRSVDEVPEDFEELQKSLACYGLPDLSAANVSSPHDQNRMQRLIYEVVAHFEPRLMDVRVTIEPARQAERAIRFKIDARLKVDPAPEPVTFDTTLQLYNGEYMVQGE